jgi:DNA-binding MarR family transcriptional regulator
MDERQGPTDLARGLHMASGAMTAVLDRLAAHGHLVRQPHPTDRRRVVLRLTDSAHEAARTEVRPMTEAITELGHRLRPSERASVARYLDALISIVAATGEETAGPRGRS